MSIESFEGYHTPICDVCGVDLPGEFDFHDAVQAKKDAGWKSRKIEGQWEDWCDGCLEDERQCGVREAFGGR